MNFQNNLTEFNFNLETLDLLKNEKLAESEIVDTLIEAGFESDLTTLLLNLNRTYLNGILVRLKLYNKLNKSGDQVMNSLQDYQNLKPLVRLLFGTSDDLQVSDYKPKQNETNTTNDNDSNKTTENDSDEEVNETVKDNKENEENEENESSDEDNFYENFFMECLESTDNKKDSVKSREIYSAFKSWYINKFTSSDVPSKTLLKKFLSEKLGKPVKNSWSSLKLTV